LQREDRAGVSTGWAELMERGPGGLVGAAVVHAGGLREARAAAGVESPVRRPPVRRWDPDAIATAIAGRARAGLPLASTKAPQRLVAAARWHFGSWEAALSAAGVDPGPLRLQRAAYTRSEVLELIRGMVRDGKVVAPSTLREEIRLPTVRRLFGSIDAAVRAAGIAAGTHGNQKWSRARVVEELKARAARGETKLTGGLHRAVQLYFGGAHAAREAAGLPPLMRAAWTEASLIAELQRRARRGEGDNALWHACKRLFGSVELARAAAGVVPPDRDTGMAVWDRRALLAELRRRRAAGKQLSRGLTKGLRREFGSLAAARALVEQGAARRRGAGEGGAHSGRGCDAGQGDSAGQGRRGAAARPAARVIEKLQAWHTAGGGQLTSSLFQACKEHFGSVVRACAAAKVPVIETPWTPRRIHQVLREPDVDVADPQLVAACIYHFGSVTAARAAVARAQHQRQWSKVTVIAELQARTRRGLKGVGRLLRDPAIRLFGSTEAALRAAALAGPMAARRVSDKRVAPR